MALSTEVVIVPAELRKQAEVFGEKSQHQPGKWRGLRTLVPRKWSSLGSSASETTSKLSIIKPSDIPCAVFNSPKAIGVGGHAPILQKQGLRRPPKLCRRPLLREAPHQAIWDAWAFRLLLAVC